MLLYYHASYSVTLVSSEEVWNLKNATHSGILDIRFHSDNDVKFVTSNKVWHTIAWSRKHNLNSVGVIFNEDSFA